MSATKSDCSSGSTASAEGAEATTSAEVSPEMIPAAIPVNISSPSPSKTISQEFQEFEGTTIFAPSPSPTYRYSLSLKNGKLRVWLEDCESKKQWCTTELDTQDYVDSTNVIPDATASDYVELLAPNSASEISWMLLTTTRPTFQAHFSGTKMVFSS
ncbi:hypothetical protein PPTG_10694 [Phytophthora nicotianae INRA-310]|uniref:Uncharacterized protein n=1 Tax=Phytophthora nicotianae (strain INRA-310) TaxID=761204 RepID=W2QCI3_PHYN3|nr:hypothetical protein PPTG_10694 [Phytophthora nicotianae INRA-310]ETN10586.1 hypothetical protein PPTG_10694 [Phytophthora nicotianae INRA-310]